MSRCFRVEEIIILIFDMFFLPPKMSGNRNKQFFDKINASFVCLIAAAIRNSLREHLLGNKLKDKVDFKYETSASK